MTLVTFYSRFWIYLFLLFVIPFPVGADDTPPFATDRPSQSDASSVVPRGYLQTEMGYTYADDDTAGSMVKSHSVPNLSLRYGLLDELELRFGWDGYTHNNPDPGATQDGAGDGQVSVKWYWWQESDWLPETSLLAGTTLPFGNTGISSERSDPFFRFLMTRSLPKGFSVSSNLGVTWSTFGSGAAKDTAADFIYTALLGYSVTPDVDTFVEFFGSVPLEEQNDSHGFDAGIAWRVLPAVQLDLSAGVGLNDAAVDAFVSTGLSFRLP